MIVTAPPAKMEQHEKMRLRAAAFRAGKVLPPGLAKLVERELLVWDEFGYRFGRPSVVMRAVDEIMKMPTVPDS